MPFGGLAAFIMALLVAPLGLVLSGTAPFSTTFAIIGSGGMISGGSATVSFDYTTSSKKILGLGVQTIGLPNADMLASVSAHDRPDDCYYLYHPQYRTIGSGGMVSGGSAPLALTRVIVPSGSAAFYGGSAFSITYAVVGSGGMVSGGSGTPCFTQAILGSGGIVSGGSAYIGFGVPSAGGLKTAIIRQLL